MFYKGTLKSSTDAFLKPLYSSAVTTSSLVLYFYMNIKNSLRNKKTKLFKISEDLILCSGITVSVYHVTSRGDCRIILKFFGCKR